MGKAIVLVVEDETIIRTNAMLMLEDANFSVIEACNADEALVVLENQETIQAVFTDITMPGSMDGWSLAQTICTRWPLIHVLVTSGLRMPIEPELSKSGRFIPKPYTASHLNAALQELFALAAGQHD